MNITHLLIIALPLTLGATGCGGGGAIGADATAASLGGYVGSWAGCADAEMMNVTIAKANNDKLNVSLVSEYFADANCDGNAVGVATYTIPTFKLTHQKTDTVSLEDPLAYPVQRLGMQNVDIFVAEASAGTISLSGAVEEGRCITGTGVCFNQLTYPQNTKTVALKLDGDLITPINFINSLGEGSGKWYADEIVWRKIN